MIETLGIIFSSFDIRDYKATTSLKTFSDEFELKIPRVKSQGNVSSCGAHVLSCIVEYFNYKQHGITTEMSVGYIYGNRKESTHKSKGLILREALNTLRLYGDVAKVDFPYNTEIPDVSNKYNRQANELYEIGYPSRISAYYRVKTIPEFKAALRLGYPIAIGVKWYSDMKVVNGVLTSKYKGYRGGHCMLLYGWNEKGWKVQNSWGKSWGNKGTCIIPYDMPIHEASDERTTWNNKSDSGHTHDFEEITNSPIAEDSSGELTIADENGNTIAKIDSNGLETTTVTAQNAVIDGVDVGIKFDELDSLIGDKSVNIQISEAISAENLSQYATDIDLSNHTSDEIIHITDDERNAWNATKINVTTAQSKADSAYMLAEGKVDSLSDLGITATATELNKLDGVTVTTAELNFIDGVTSNIQTQLNNKLTYNVVTSLPSTGTNGALYVIK